MEEAIVDSAPDLNLPPSECSVQSGVQEDMLTDNQAQFLASVQKGFLASRRWPQNRAAWVENLRQSVTSGVYHVDSAKLALCIWRNSTRFLETSSTASGTSPNVSGTR